MNNYLEKLRAKPEHVRRRIAFLLSLVITGVIFFSWFVSFGIKTSSEKSVQARSPISTLTASVGDAFGYVKGLFFGSNEIKYDGYDSIEVTPGDR